MSNAKTPHWSKLDNAAKIFPSTSTRRDTKVFRFACELYEVIDGDVLQTALNHTMELFPFYRSVLKKGLFWYYFEDSPLSPTVQIEAKPPCSPIYNGDRKTLLFEVTYYQKRISLEVYHALSDGTGALHFLRTLVFYYITQKHADDFVGRTPLIDYDASETQKKDDSFSRYYSKEKGTHHDKSAPHPNRIKAYRLHGERFTQNSIAVIEGRMSVKALLEKAHEKHATLTAFLTAMLICAIHEGMTVREETRPVVVTIPVNLRNYFPSASARNFFSVINVGYNFKTQEDKLEAVIAHVTRCFGQELTTEGLRARMNRLSGLEHNVPAKLIPLIGKDLGMRIANRLSEQEITAAFSNIGRVDMPAEVVPYIRLFDVFTSTKRLQACMCSFQDHFVLSFTSPFISTDVQRCFFRRLTAMGLEVEITTSLAEDRKEWL